MRQSSRSRSEMSRRVQIRSITARSTAWVCSFGSRRRSQVPGTEGADQRAFVSHQASQEPTAARLRFQVVGFAWPQSLVMAAPISSSSTSTRARARQTVGGSAELGSQYRRPRVQGGDADPHPGVQRATSRHWIHRPTALVASPPTVCLALPYDPFAG
jgi:hypothetical protein